MESMEKIDKCSFCNEKGEYLYIKSGFFNVRMEVLCNKHRLMLNKNRWLFSWRKRRNLMDEVLNDKRR